MSMGRKVDSACIYCRRSHMTCDVNRPCQRCIKRKIGHLCRDEVSRPEVSPVQNPTDIIQDIMGDFDWFAGPNIESMSSKDQFLLTAADPVSQSAEGRLSEVLEAKHNAGLLKPYNYAAGYDRLRRYMDSHMSSEARSRILQPLSRFRPAFRSVARSLQESDLEKVEEFFERILLDYDRTFTLTAMPACLWRRTGEIYRGNKEFATLVGVEPEELREGRLAIHELMTEDSTVRYWEKFSGVAFDIEQKAVLSKCDIRNSSGACQSCCFAFTVRRDRYNIPVAIIGNFIPMPTAA